MKMDLRLNYQKQLNDETKKHLESNGGAGWELIPSSLAPGDYYLVCMCCGCALQTVKVVEG